MIEMDLMRELRTNTDSFMDLSQQGYEHLFRLIQELTNRKEELQEALSIEQDSPDFVFCELMRRRFNKSISLIHHTEMIDAGKMAQMQVVLADLIRACDSFDEGQCENELYYAKKYTDEYISSLILCERSQKTLGERLALMSEDLDARLAENLQEGETLFCIDQKMTAFDEQLRALSSALPQMRRWFEEWKEYLERIEQ